MSTLQPESRTATDRRATRLGETEVVVLMGGRSAERDVSLRSGEGVRVALASLAPPDRPAQLHQVEIAADGTWLVDGTTLAPARAVERLPADALFFLALHGGDGENGVLQGFLQAAGRRYTGSGVAASALCMDKERARRVCVAAGVQVAPGRMVTVREWRQRRAECLAAFARLGREWYVKPNSGGSSVATSHVERADALGAAVDRAMRVDREVLVEAAVHGVEATCAVFGNHDEEPRVLQVVEIQPKPGRFFDYEEKYSAAGAREVCPPENLSQEESAAVRAQARTAYLALGCEGYARLDFLVAEGLPYLLEANTLPGLTERSLLPIAAAAEGLDFGDLCRAICESALRRAAGVERDFDDA